MQGTELLRLALVITRVTSRNTSMFVKGANTTGAGVRGITGLQLKGGCGGYANGASEGVLQKGDSTA